MANILSQNHGSGKHRIKVAYVSVSLLLGQLDFSTTTTHNLNKVIGTRGQGVGVGCPRELTTEHLTEASLQLEKLLRGSASFQLQELPRSFQAFGHFGLS